MFLLSSSLVLLPVFVVVLAAVVLPLGFLLLPCQWLHKLQRGVVWFPRMRVCVVWVSDVREKRRREVPESVQLPLPSPGVVAAAVVEEEKKKLGGLSRGVVVAQRQK